jgi:predicted dehydrogenase
MKNKVSLAIIGAGYWGKKLLPKFLLSDEGRVRAICDVHPDHHNEIQRTYPNIPTTTRFDEILADPMIEAVVLATPPATHFCLARKALEVGKHVWIEKPLALSMAEGCALVALSEAKGTVLFVDHTFLYDPAIRKIRELIAAGALGRIYHIFCQRLNLGRIKRDSNVWWNSAPHDISILLFLLNSAPKSIALHGYRYLQPKLEDLDVAVVELADGASAVIYHNWLFPENSAKLTVVGSERMLVYEGKFDKRALTVYDYAVEQDCDPLENPQELPTTIPSRLIHEQTLAALTEPEPLALAVSDFLTSITCGGKPVSDGVFSLKVLKALAAGEQSLRSGGAKIPI